MAILNPNLISAQEEFESKMAELEPLLTDPTSHRFFDKIKQVNDVYLSVTNESIKIFRATGGDSNKAGDYYFGPLGQQCRTDLKAATVELVGWYTTLAVNAEAEQVAKAQSASPLTLLFSVLALLIGMGVALLVIHSLIASIQPMVCVLE